MYRLLNTNRYENYSVSFGPRTPMPMIDALCETQVLSPMKAGPAGTRSLNLRLQALLNPPQPSKAEFVRRASDPTSVFRVGDRVIQVPVASMFI